VAVELRAGFSTFLTIAYILVLNPQILNAAGKISIISASAWTMISAKSIRVYRSINI
jgi:xanthine/uracil/vitamin C permease (AzgA family)